MSVPKEPSKSKLVISFISESEPLINASIKRIGEEFSPPDFVSEFTGFTQTEYYNDEMGGALKRRFATFKELFPRGELARVKLFTNTVENDNLESGRRRINIDPGFLSVENFILATGKNFTHRVYMRNGIFADLTLVYTKNDFAELPWTYPDYKGRDIKDMLKKIRVVSLL